MRASPYTKIGNFIVDARGNFTFLLLKKKLSGQGGGGASPPPPPPPPTLDPRLTVYGVFNVITAHEEFTFEYSY